MPSLPPDCESICSLMPITSPPALNSGPPELPGLIEASVWMPPVMVAPFGDWISRSTAETTPRREREVEAERVADGHDLLADGDLGRVAQLDGGEGRRLARIDLEEGDVGRLVDADDGGGDLGALIRCALEDHLDVARGLPALADHVGVGEDLAVLRHDEAGADALPLARDWPHMSWCRRTST